MSPSNLICLRLSSSWWILCDEFWDILYEGCSIMQRIYCVVVLYDSYCMAFSDDIKSYHLWLCGYLFVTLQWSTQCISLVTMRTYYNSGLFWTKPSNNMLKMTCSLIQSNYFTCGGRANAEVESCSWQMVSSQSPSLRIIPRKLPYSNLSEAIRASSSILSISIDSGSLWFQAGDTASHTWRCLGPSWCKTDAPPLSCVSSLNMVHLIVYPWINYFIA